MISPIVKPETSLSEFAAWCLAEAERAEHHGTAYARKTVQRFYDTYQLCTRYARPGISVLSVGAGGAYVEKRLQQAFNAHVTVLDFPQVIEQHASDYAQYDFRGVGCDLSSCWSSDDLGQFDLALSFEILEHLPMAPREHIRALAARLAPGGRLVLTTPNLARLSSVVRLLAGKPILDDPNLTFPPTCYEREHVHRREYVAAELHDAVKQAGLEPERTEYRLYLAKHGVTAATCAFRVLSTLNPRFRNTILLVARKP